MTDALEHALALLFRRFRDPPVSEDDLVKGMSLTLNWTKPSRAKHLLARGVQEGLLKEDQEAYAPLFDPSDVDVPFGFDPPSELFEPVEAPRDDGAQDAPEAAPEEESPEDKAPASRPVESPVLESLIDAITERLDGEDRTRAVAAVNAKEEELGGLVTLPAAALIVAKEHGVDVTQQAGEVLETLAQDANGPA